jgi:arsenate reductase
MEEERKIKVLFLCPGKSTRCHMAAGWTKKLQNKLIEPYATSIEGNELSEYSIAVMQEEGIDIASIPHYSFEELKNFKFDYVIDMGCNTPNIFSQFKSAPKYLRVNIPNPYSMAEKFTAREMQLDCYRKVRERIKKFVETLPKMLANIS